LQDKGHLEDEGDLEDEEHLEDEEGLDDEGDLKEKKACKRSLLVWKAVPGAQLEDVESLKRGVCTPEKIGL
jgi:hypothetical protein